MTRIAFVEREVELPGGALVVRTAGQGHPIIHLHSAGGPRVSPVLAALSQRYRVLAPIAPGFAGTQRPASVASIRDYADLLAQYIERDAGGSADVIGESFGGWVALWLAARHPGRVSQMVLEAPAGLRPQGTPDAPLHAEERRRKLYAFPERAPADAREPQILAGDLEAIARYRNDVAFDHDLAEALGAINARTLILMGAQDELIPPETGRLLKSRLPHAHLTYVFEAGHALEIDQPDRVFRIIVDFLDRGESFLVKAASGG
ncbi:MAG TPA: alpha/beta hydrolase [Beijerinckiaceae bacterium]|nr:alpha/beta hydrolase [Beijerinckiaceae bacterium]HVB88842.1 alpha/beta hydrolase [Beijerinckiaceae bacterium]